MLTKIEVCEFLQVLLKVFASLFFLQLYPETYKKDFQAHQSWFSSATIMTFTSTFEQPDSIAIVANSK